MKMENYMGLTLNTRLREKASSGFKVVTKPVPWKPEKSAVIISDMWDTHHCISAAKRVAEMAPHMNKVIVALREMGALIIHAPSDCEGRELYKDTPQRRRAQNAPHAETSVEFQWNKWNLKREASLPSTISDPGPCSCHTSEPCCKAGYYPWTRQIETIEIGPDDAIVHGYNQEAYNLLQQCDIDDVVVMGVHTNVCVLSRSFGIRQLVYVGKKPLLCRDLTDSFHQHPDGHFRGTDIIIEHIEKYWCPTVTSGELVGGKPFRFREDNRDY